MPPSALFHSPITKFRLFNLTRYPPPRGAASFLLPGKTFRLFLSIENEYLTKEFDLKGNDLETSEVLYCVSFCIKSKERFYWTNIRFFSDLQKYKEENEILLFGSIIPYVGKKEVLPFFSVCHTFQRLSCQYRCVHIAILL